ncbi:MAG: hypothetical protein ACOYA9_12175 [Bilifractor sp.]|jgi:hypothetical protein
MIDFTINVAEKNILFHVSYSSSKKFCSRYLTDNPADLEITIGTEDLAKEREKLKLIDAGASLFSNPNLERLSMHRKLADQMLDYNTLLFHGSVIAVDGKAYMFVASSGTGKSTHSRIWRENLSDQHEVFMVNDDKPFLKVTDNQVIAFGSPWDGKHRLSRNVGVPLAAIAKLERGTTNFIEPMKREDRIKQFVSGAYIPKSTAPRLKAIQLLYDAVICRVPCYRLQCNMEPAAAFVSYKGMSDNK